MGEVAGKAIEAGRDFLGHWNGLQRNITEFCFRKLILWMLYREWIGKG